MDLLCIILPKIFHHRCPLLNFSQKLVRPTKMPDPLGVHAWCGSSFPDLSDQPGLVDVFHGNPNC